MKRLSTRLLLGFACLVVLGVLALGGWYVYRAVTRPTLAKNGGTLLVYEVEGSVTPDLPLPADFSAEELVEPLRRRLDSTGMLGITVRAVDPRRVEIGIPRAGDHAEQVERVKELLAATGHLEFRILANAADDDEAIQAAREYIEAPNDPNVGEVQGTKRKQELAQFAERGVPPPGPTGPQDGAFETAKGKFRYSWVEVSAPERKSLGVDNAAENDPGPIGEQWRQVAANRQAGKVTPLPAFSRTLLYSRGCADRKLSPTERALKKYDYFLLARDPLPGQEVTGAYLAHADLSMTAWDMPAVSFRFNEEGGNRFYALTSANRPTGGGDERGFRHLAIILDRQIMTAPRLNEAIRSEGQITGNFTEKEVERLAAILRAGALPAALKRQPVSETTVEPTR